MATDGPFSGQVALVTGASSGIGEALAREMARQGAKVVLCARRLDRLERIVAEIAGAGGEALALACDVTRDGELERVVEGAVGRFGRLDVAVANAGISVLGTVDRLSLDDYRRQLETNVFGVLRTAQAARDELKRSHGCLAIVGSISAYLAVPGTAAYAMSKFAVRAFADAAATEWRRHGVAVVLINPGFVDSEIRAAGTSTPYDPATDPVPRWMRMRRHVAARQIAGTIARRRRERVLTVHGKVAVFLARHLPWLLRAAVVRGIGWRFKPRGARKSPTRQTPPG